VLGVTWFSALQAALAVAALFVIARRLHALLFEAPLDARVFVTALEPALRAKQLELAETLARACLPAWPARHALSGLAELRAGRDPQPALEESRAELDRRLGHGRDAISVLGRMASPLAFIGVIVETGNALGGGEGLSGLQRGLPEMIALQRSLLAFALGVATAIVCFTAAGIAQRAARSIRRDLERVAQAIMRGDAP
jgi:hypothetical protein